MANSLFNPLLSPDADLGSFSDGAFAEPQAPLGAVKRKQTQAVQEKFQEVNLNLNNLQANSPYKDRASRSAYVSDPNKIETLRKQALAQLETPRGALDLRVQDPFANSSKGAGVLQRYYGANEDPNDPSAGKKLTKQEIADVYVAMATADKESPWYKEYVSANSTEMGTKKPRDNMGLDRTSLAYAAYERNIQYQKAINDKSIDDISRQEITDMYQAGETAKTLGTKLTEAQAKKGEYALRTITQKEAQLQQLPGMGRPSRAGVL